MNDSARPHGKSADVALGMLIAILVAPGVLLWLAGGIGAELVHHRWPAAGLGIAPGLVLGIAHHLGTPEMAWPPRARSVLGGPVLLYVVFAVLLTGACGGAITCWSRLGRRRRPGFAHRGELRANLSEAAARARGPQVRPGLKLGRRSGPEAFGVHLGRDATSGTELWASLEDSFLVLGPPRSGKGVSLVIPGVLGAPGAAVVTSTRPDVLRHTAGVRVGPVEVFDPQGASHWPTRLRWSPVAGCEDPLIAIRRGRGFAAGAGFNQATTDAEFWTASAAAVIRVYLHAAALGGRTMADVIGWAARPQDAEPVRILRGCSDAAPGWAEDLASQGAFDARTRDGIWAGVRRAFDCLADPRVLDACSPRETEAFDAEKFLAESGTLYVVGSSGAQLSVAPLITALVEDLAERALQIAGAAPSGRLDPPLSLWLDEVANIAPLDSLPSLLSAGGGSGICTVVVLQSLAQARARWGADRADAMWDASTVRVVLGGLGHADDLTRISRLAGDIDEDVLSTSRGAGGTSWSTSPRSRAVLPLERLRALAPGRAVILHRRTPPVEAQLEAWWDRRCAAEVDRALERNEALCGRAA